MKKLYIVDFDGTYYTGNSFHDFLVFVAKQAVDRKRFLFLVHWVFKIISYYILRKMEVKNHADLSYAMISLFEQKGNNEFKSEVLDKFLTELNKGVSKELHEFLEKECKNGNYFILATAASEIYMNGFIESHPIFDSMIATPSTGKADWFHNIKRNKLKSVIDFLEKNDLEDLFKVVVTDHRDDLPLIEYCEEAIVLPPLSNERHITENKAISQKVRIFHG